MSVRLVLTHVTLMLNVTTLLALTLVAVEMASLEMGKRALVRNLHYCHLFHFYNVYVNADNIWIIIFTLWDRKLELHFTI